jgi:cytoplasmic iron level regulating protein YaaA (DUF328/UPF0246 family)
MIILLHSSKTMRPPNLQALPLQKPELLDKAVVLSDYLKTLSPKQLAKTMHVTPTLAEKTYNLIEGWTDVPSHQRSAIDSFLGDVYSGLQVPNFTAEDREYADQTLRILSGLYGILRPLDGIYPYRLEMGYRLPAKKFANQYVYWGNSIARCLPTDDLIINLAANEYSKVVTDYLDSKRIITPSFLTINQKTEIPTFVVVHAKIARGAFAHWLIKNRVIDPRRLQDFKDLGYVYDKKLSSISSPVFVCHDFGGLGLSQRLK